jgi:DNA repair exonuclease SbcCD nuclease subunit
MLRHGARQDSKEATVRFIHTADWQVGKPFAGIRDPLKRALVQRARIDVIARIGGAARDAEAEFIVVAGDFFDSPSADKATVSAACSAIGQIGVPVFVIPGNHDHGGPGSVWEQEFFKREQAALAPNLTILLTPTPHPCASAVLLPCPLLRRRAAQDPTAWLRDPAVYADLPPGTPRIVLAHGSTQTFAGHWEDEEAEGPTGNLLDLARLPDAEIDYVALGDWHGTKQVAATAWFAGTPELDRFVKGADHDPGNVLLVDVQRGGRPQVVSMPLASLRWQELRFDFADDGALPAFQDRIDTLLGARANQDLLDLTLTGSLGIEASKRLEDLLESLHARLLRMKLTDQTRIAPTAEEMESLTQRAADPLIANVAARLVQAAGGDTEDAHIARIALRELYAVCTQEAGS